MKCTKIDSEKIEQFLDHMKETYEGKLNHYLKANVSFTDHFFFCRQPVRLSVSF